MSNLSPKLQEFAHSTRIVSGVTIKLQGYAGRNKSNNALFYATCDLCMQDSELYSTPFVVEKGTIDRGIIPCGCSKTPRYTIEQYKILIERELHRRGLGEIYLKGLPTEGKVQNKMKIQILKSCGEVYEVSLTHLFTSETGLRKRGASHKISDEDFLGVALERTSLTDVTNFIVNFEENTVKYYCNKCNEHFHTKRNLLLAGRVPCGCAERPAFNRAKPANLYVVRWYNDNHSYLKFGITNREVLARVKDQSRNSPLNYEILHTFHHPSGQAVFDCEKIIKQSNVTSVCPKEYLPDGYTETVEDTPDILESILHIANKNLK
ncbi:hypothetical protein KUA24_30 [Vibrio phage HNL01]|nr:hypothetical protein KUA24_30 [Vibrio phage HNL01]